jgi:hypothetical protein
MAAAANPSPLAKYKLVSSRAGCAQHPAPTAGIGVAALARVVGPPPSPGEPYPSLTRPRACPHCSSQPRPAGAGIAANSLGRGPLRGP